MMATMKEGCCASGQRCDEICIALVAAEFCRDALHDRGCAASFQSSCDEPKITGACSEGRQECTNDRRLEGAFDEPTTCVSDIAGDCCSAGQAKVPDDELSLESCSNDCCRSEEAEEELCCAADDACCRTESAVLAASAQEEDRAASSCHGRTPACAEKANHDQTSSPVMDDCCKSPNEVVCVSGNIAGSTCITSGTMATEQPINSCCAKEKETSTSTSSSPSGCCQPTSVLLAGDCANEKRFCCTSDDPDTQSTICSTNRFADEDIISEFKVACSTHLEEAIKKYTSYLEAGICICRNVLTRAQSCCDTDKRAAALRKRKTAASISTSNCAGVSSPRKRRKTGNTAEAKLKASTVTDQPVSSGGIIGCATRTGCGNNVEKGRCTTTAMTDIKANCNSKTTCDDGTKQCRPSTPEEISQRLSNFPSSRSKGLTATDTVEKVTDGIKTKGDIEDDAAREHVIFSITGMTCTGCVKKVQGVLGHLTGIEHVQINFVNGLGEFDADTALLSADKALGQLEKETGFRCRRIASDCQSIELIMTRPASEAFSNDLPPGVKSIERAGKLYRVTFDPLTIGARELLAQSGGSLAPPGNDGIVVDGRRNFRFKLWSLLAATIFTIPVVVLAWSEAPVGFLAKSVVSLVLGTVVQAVAIPEFYIPALKALIFSRSIEMDMLVVISITAAYGYSVVAFGLEHAGIELEQGEFFETSTLLITLVLLGRVVSSYAKLRAVRAVSLRSLQVDMAYLEDSAGEITQIDARLLEFNDVVRVPPHSKIVSDGEVVSGSSTVDESMLTGEDRPISKSVGDFVIAGTLNGSGPLTIRISRLPGQNSITDIADLVQNALNNKPRIQDLADTVAGYFVPVVVAVSAIVFAIWLAVALKVRHQNAGGAIGTAITYAVAVLAISCPCALGLAVPLVLVIAGGVAVRDGVIIKQADATERGFKVTDVVFDKTGTLTCGQLRVMRQEVIGSELATADESIALAYALVSSNEHPISQAVATDLKSQNRLTIKLEKVESVPGAGIQAVWKGHTIKAGNARWLGIATHPSVVSLQGQGFTLLCVTVQDQPVLCFGLQADTRPEAHAVIKSLQIHGLNCHIVSGDHFAAVLNIATTLDIPVRNIAASQSPADKQAYLQRLIASGRKTLFVGDGTNDAVAIAQANVGVQIGSASDISRATADVVLLGGLDGIITLLDVSKQSYCRIILNFVWSFVYNLFAILLASGAFVKVRIAPSFAGLGEIVSVLPIILIALSLRWIKIGKH